MATTTWGVEVLHVHCDQCGKVFEREVLPELLYGTLDFYTEDGTEMVIVQAAGNPICDEISDFVDTKCSNISFDAQRECFWHILKYAVDPVNGKRIDPFYKIRCIYCGSFSLDTDSYHPAKFRTVTYPLATYTQWMAYNQQEREAIMLRILDDAGCNCAHAEQQEAPRIEKHTKNFFSRWFHKGTQ